MKTNKEKILSFLLNTSDKTINLTLSLICDKKEDENEAFLRYKRNFDDRPTDIQSRAYDEFSKRREKLYEEWKDALDDYNYFCRNIVELFFLEAIGIETERDPRTNEHRGNESDGDGSDGSDGSDGEADETERGNGSERSGAEAPAG